MIREDQGGMLVTKSRNYVNVETVLLLSDCSELVSDFRDCRLLRCDERNDEWGK